MIDDRSHRRSSELEAEAAFRAFDGDVAPPFGEADTYMEPATTSDRLTRPVALQAELARAEAFTRRLVLQVADARADQQAALRHVAALEALIARAGSDDLRLAAAELYGSPP
jgi:hypothetical protein